MTLLSEAYLRAAGVVLLGALLAAPSTTRGATPAPALDGAALVKILQTIDERTRSPGDYKALVYMLRKEQGAADIAQEAILYRRDVDRRMMIVFTKPKSEQGKGYLRVDNNLWIYDPGVGKWERRTERERIGGTDSRREDFDQSHLAEDYNPAYERAGKLGSFEVHILSLTVKPGMEVAYPVVKLWVDAATGNTLKRQDFALSGRLMRTLYYPKWEKAFSESKKGDVWFPREIHILDEVQKANATLVRVQKIDLRPLPENNFTKAWLESQTR